MKKKTKWPTGGVCRNVIPYGGNVWLFTDRKKWQQAAEFCNSGAHVRKSVGLCLWAENTKGHQIYIVGVFNQNVGTLVHELTHACLNIAKHAGFDAGDGNGEPFCYLLDNLFARLKDDIRTKKVR